MPRPEEEFGKAVGRRIRRLRRVRGLTQKQICEATGLDTSGLSRYENGYQVPNSQGLRRLAEALGVTTDELLGASPGSALEQLEDWLLRFPPVHHDPLRRLIHSYLKTHGLDNLARSQPVLAQEDD